MNSEQNKVDLLTAFKLRDKFSDQAWNNRGLNPSSSEISSNLTRLFNLSADELIEAVQNNASEKQLKSLLKSQLSKFNKHDYDTEEKEFICELFFELAQIVNIDFKDNLSSWLYGSALTTLMKIRAALNPRKVIETINQNCPTCKTSLDTFILKKEEGIPDYSWMIVQCKNCKDYSIVNPGPNVKEMKFDNYLIVEQLPKTEFNIEQAEIRLEQIRHFRK